MYSWNGLCSLSFFTYSWTSVFLNYLLVWVKQPMILIPNSWISATLFILAWIKNSCLNIFFVDSAEAVILTSMSRWTHVTPDLIWCDIFNIYHITVWYIFNCTEGKMQGSSHTTVPSVLYQCRRFIVLFFHCVPGGLKRGRTPAFVSVQNYCSPRTGGSNSSWAF